MSDRPEEIEALAGLVDRVGIDMIQMRNLSLDPVVYLSALGLSGEGIGMLAMLHKHKERFPKLQYGYFNRTRENFFPAGYETEWPISA